MTLGELIEMLAAQDSDKVCKYGFDRPHSWRGIYADLAFEPAEDQTFGQMLECARGALGKTFTGYKGGDYVMSEWVDVHISNYGESRDVLPEYGARWMLGDTNPDARQEHVCEKPDLPTEGTVSPRPDWECGICGRVWQCIHYGYGGAWWWEVRGPRRKGVPV